MHFGHSEIADVQTRLPSLSPRGREASGAELPSVAGRVPRETLVHSHSCECSHNGLGRWSKGLRGECPALPGSGK